VALSDAILYTVGFVAIGLDYALLLGCLVGLLSFVPYMGVFIGLIPTLLIAATQFHDWLHPLLALGVFGLVQTIEGLLIAPKILGDRVGLHPLTIIVGLLIGMALMGNLVGGLLAIPLTAALRVIMFRYVWRKRSVRT